MRKKQQQHHRRQQFNEFMNTNGIVSESKFLYQLNPLIRDDVIQTNLSYIT